MPAGSPSQVLVLAGTQSQVSCKERYTRLVSGNHQIKIIHIGAFGCPFMSADSKFSKAKRKKTEEKREREINIEQMNVIYHTSQQPCIATKYRILKFDQSQGCLATYFCLGRSVKIIHVWMSADRTSRRGFGAHTPSHHCLPVVIILCISDHHQTRHANIADREDCK